MEAIDDSQLGKYITMAKKVFIILTTSIDIEDLSDVLKAVQTLAAKWKLLSTNLGMKQETIELIQHNNSRDAMMCLLEALAEWLKLNYTYQRHGKPSWRKLAEAVKSLNYVAFEAIVKAHVMAS